MIEDQNVRECLADPHVSEVLTKANIVMEQGHAVYFKITCAGCGDRFWDNYPNNLAAMYKHEDCGHMTKTIDGDLGFTMIATFGALPSYLHPEEN